MSARIGSLFSGYGGLDVAVAAVTGGSTAWVSDIDKGACKILTHRYGDVPNLGDITKIDWSTVEPVDILTGGFPCQDLSVAGKRAGFAGARSSLAFAFLDLVERHRPPAILLENVPGLLSSNAGRDFGRLLREMGELGYWWAYRVLDARHFGVPQRRRRVFILGLHARVDFGADSAAAVLSVGTRCPRHPATGHATGDGAADSPVLGTLDTSLGHHGGAWGDQAVNNGHVIADGQHGSSPDPSGVRAADGLAGRLDDREVVVVKRARAQTNEDDESWGEGSLMPTLNAFDVGDTRTTAAIIGAGPQDDPLLPLGLDSHRYRCCGNGVVSDVSEWIGWRLRAAVEGVAA